MTIYINGGCMNNGHPDPDQRIMKAVVTDDAGRMLVEKTRQGGSNNIAALWAVVEALMFAKSQKTRNLDIVTDSKNNLAWMAGRIGKKLNDKRAVLNLIRAIGNLEEHVKFTITWLPRRGGSGRN